MIDGLPKSQYKKYAVGLRQQGVKTRKITGRKDETEPFIRLADAICGLVNHANEGIKEYLDLLKEAEQASVISRL